MESEEQSMMARAPALLAVATTVAACGPTIDGVAVAPLRPGPPLVRFEHARPAAGSTLTVRIVAPESRERSVKRAITAAFEACAGPEGDGEAGCADAAAGAIRAAGFDDFMTCVCTYDHLGVGYFAGDAGGEPWRVTLRDPGGAAIATVAIRDQAVHTSSAPEGFPLVTVVASDATTAGAAAAEAIAAGPAEGLALLQSRKLDAVIVSAPGEGALTVMVTRGLKGRIDITKGFGGEVRWASAPGRARR